MRVMVSSCLLGENCKYNGGNNRHAGVLRYLADKEVVPVCPERLAGFPVPRPCMELKNGRAVDCEGNDVHDALCEGVRRAVELAKREGVELAILQSRSPSCGVDEVYDGSFSHKRIAGRGVFAQALCDAGIPVKDASDYGEKD